MGSAVTHSDWDLQRERLSAYLDGEVSADERTTLEAHLPSCEQCQRELAAYRQMRALLGALPAPSLPRSFTLPAQPVRDMRPRRAPAWSRPAQAIGSIAAMVGLSLLLSASLPHMGTARSVAGASTSSGASAEHMPKSAATLSPSGASPTVQSGASATAPTPAQTPMYGPEFSSGNTVAPAQSEFPVAPVSGGVLLVGGVATATAGSLARRRARRDALEV